MSKLSMWGIVAAACLLLTASVRCETAPAPATLILLQHTVPTEFLKTMHWDQAGTLPAGVSQITALPADNALSVVATPAGLAKVREIVAVMDVEPRQVEIQFALATAADKRLDASGVTFALVPLGGLLKADASPEDFLRYASGKPVAALLASLVKGGEVGQSPIVSTTNNVSANVNFSNQPSFQVTPRINSDDSVTLALEIAFSSTEPATILDLKTLRTVKNGETLVIVKKMSGGSNLLWFVTPICLPKH